MSSMQITLILSLLYWLFVLGAAILLLKGFFEKRSNDTYKFRTKRFLFIFSFLFALHFLVSIFVLQSSAEIVTEAIDIAEKAIIQNRQISEYTMDNLSVMFPEILAAESKKCYRAALSNYIEDQWEFHFKKENCDKNSAYCAKDESDYFKNLIKRSKERSFVKSLKAFQETTGTTWKTAASIYPATRRLMQTPDTNGKKPAPPDKRETENYLSYWSNCHSLTPLPWATVDAPLLTSRPHLTFGE